MVSNCGKFLTWRFYDVGPLGIAEKLNVDVKVGLEGNDFEARRLQFGDNFRPNPVAKSWISLFIAALDDFMLKVLIVAAIFSITFDMILADAHSRSHGKFQTFIIYNLLDRRALFI